MLNRFAAPYFFDSNIQADFVAVGGASVNARLIYLPYPVMLMEETVVKLREVKGGTLISEGLPAYFGDHGHVGF